MPGVMLWGWDETNQVPRKVLVNEDGKLIIDPSEIFENDPTDDEHGKAPDSDWAYEHENNASAHHARYTDAEAILATAASYAAITHATRHYFGGSDELDFTKLGDIDAVANLISRGRVFQIPCQGWTESVSGSASIVQSPYRLYLETGATANSTAIAWAYATGFVGSDVGNYLRPDFSKKLIIIVDIVRTGSASTNFVGYFHFKSNNSHGDADIGSIGLKIEGFTLYGESYGTSGQALTSALCTLHNYNHQRVMIVHDPSVPRIDWYLSDGEDFPSTPTASQTTSGYIPQAVNGATTTFVFSGDNGADEINCIMAYFAAYFWMESN